MMTGMADETLSWRALPRPAKWMLSSLIFDFIGTGLIMPFGVVYLHEVRELPLETAGVLLALPAIVGLVVVGPGGVLIDRAGARAVVIAAVVLETIAQVVLANATTAPVAAFSFVLSGLAGGVIFPAVQAMVAAVMPPGQRQHYFGLSFTLLNLGLGIGGLVGGALVSVDRPGTFQALYYIDAASFLVPLAIYLGPLRRYGGRPRAGGGDMDLAAAPVDGTSRGGYRDVFRDPAMRLLIVLGFITGFIGYAQFGVGFQAFARDEARISTQALGWAYAANTIVIVVAQLFVLRLVTGRRRTRSLLVMCALWALAWAVMGVAGHVPATGAAIVFMSVAATVFGVGETFLQPTLPAMVNDLAPDELRGRYNSASAGAFHVAEVAGPPFAGFVMGHGLGAWYAVLLVLGCLGAGLVTLRAEGRLSPHVNGTGRAQSHGPEGELGTEVQRAKIVAE